MINQIVKVCPQVFLGHAPVGSQVGRTPAKEQGRLGGVVMRGGGGRLLGVGWRCCWEGLGVGWEVLLGGPKGRLEVLLGGPRGRLEVLGGRRGRLGGVVGRG
jgi:hypothetical protein